jgi:hypothetical protein
MRNKEEYAMPCKMRFVRGAVSKKLLVPLALILLAPVAALAGSLTCFENGVVCIDNNGGSAVAMGSGTGTQIDMNGLGGSTVSTVNIIGIYGGPKMNLGTLSFTTGGLLPGFTLNLTSPGQSADFGPGTFTINASIPGFSGVLFSGTFGTATSPIVWTFTGTTGKGSNKTYDYTLSGVLNGTYEGGVLVAGQTTQLFFESKTPWTGTGPITLGTGTTDIQTPEPGTLGLMGSGLIGLGFVVKRKIKASLSA